MASESAKVNRRRFVRRAFQGTVAAGAVLGGYAWRVEPHWIEITRRRMPVAGLPPAWRGKRLVQISDLHVGPVVDPDYLRGALRTVAGLSPDVVVVTGDWMTCDGPEQVGQTIEVFGELETTAPVVGILGNHDYGRASNNPRPANLLTDALRNAGVELLRNEHTEIDGLQFAGVDELWARRFDVEATLADLDSSKPAIMLCHNPDAVDARGWGGYRGWILSGHTHGGQCRFPLLGAPIVPIRNHRYVAGQIDLGDGRLLYVNRALGYKSRVRFLTRPEITVFDLQPA